MIAAMAKKPPNLIYGVEDQPPLLVLLLLGINTSKGG